MQCGPDELNAAKGSSTAYARCSYVCCLNVDSNTEHVCVRLSNQKVENWQLQTQTGMHN